MSSEAASTSSRAGGLKTAAIAQLRSTSCKKTNLFDVARCAGWAKQSGSKMLFLPECFGFMGENAQQTLANAEPPLSAEEAANCIAISNTLKEIVQASSGATDVNDDSLTSRIPDEVSENNNLSLLDGLKTIARESRLWISAGGMHVSGAPPDANDKDQRPRLYNTHIILDDSGSIVCTYRKIHLFDVSIPNKVNLKESSTTAPGTELIVCDSPVGRLGLSTCYDVRFPEMYVDLVAEGAEVLLVPSAFTVPTGNAHWNILLRARAIESQCYVLAAAQYGRHNHKRESYGHSLTVDPWGKVIADAGGCDGRGTLADDVELKTPSIITCDIDLDSINSTRERLPIQSHRQSSSFSFHH